MENGQKTVAHSLPIHLSARNLGRLEGAFEQGYSGFCLENGSTPLPSVSLSVAARCEHSDVETLGRSIANVLDM